MIWPQSPNSPSMTTQGTEKILRVKKAVIRKRYTKLQYRTRTISTVGNANAASSYESRHSSDSQAQQRSLTIDYSWVSDDNTSKQCCGESADAESDWNRSIDVDDARDVGESPELLEWVTFVVDLFVGGRERHDVDRWDGVTQPLILERNAVVSGCAPEIALVEPHCRTA